MSVINSSDVTKSTGWISIGNQTFAYVVDNESYEYGDRQLESSYICAYTHKNKQVTKVLMSKSFYNETFMSSMFDLLNGLKLFPHNTEQKHIVSFQTLKCDEFIFRCSPNFDNSPSVQEWIDWVNLS